MSSQACSASRVGGSIIQAVWSEGAPPPACVPLLPGAPKAIPSPIGRARPTLWISSHAPCPTSPLQPSYPDFWALEQAKPTPTSQPLLRLFPLCSPHCTLLPIFSFLLVTSHLTRHLIMKAFPGQQSHQFSSVFCTKVSSMYLFIFPFMH